LKPLLALQPSINGLIDLDAVIDYIFERQNSDGGYTFCRWTESNAQDTFYALSILDMLGFQPRTLDKTIDFLKSLQHEDGGFDSIKIAYYVIKSLLMFGEETLRKPKLTEYLPNLVRNLKSPLIDVEVVSEVESLYMLIDLCMALNISIDSREIVDAVLGIKNSDGSFGSSRRSRLASTFYALGVLKILNYDVGKLTDTLRWIRRCEHPKGGFISSSEAEPTYLEDTYFGLKSLEVLNERVSYPMETLMFIAKLQNPNGGFRRSIFLGISDFESTYQALSSIKILLSPLGLGWL